LSESVSYHLCFLFTHCKVTTITPACQEVTFLAHSNLFIGFADYQGEKISSVPHFFDIAYNREAQWQYIQINY